MKIIRTVPEMLGWRASLSSSDRVALVPTMGFLHAGHLSLLHDARRRVPPEAGPLVLSIFVNPTQFGPGEDLDAYPRDEAKDLELAESASVDVVFTPSDPQEVYPSEQTWVNVEGLSSTLCGESRPGHFRGVCTVVAKLWMLVRPDVAVFGEKDYQQLAILRRMHADLFLGGEVASMPIVREDDGLAMSSRNANLGPEARAAALRLPGFRGEVLRRFEAGQRNVPALLAGAGDALAPGTIDYVQAVDASSLQAVDRVVAPTLVAFAVRYGGVRLIDNVVLLP
ncbi:MAG: pantoate--beta-alanine ligase [Nannocystaceae bacterium]|nr:pantoate--beta-alanine ligase [Nannocystaceae bacterium]